MLEFSKPQKYTARVIEKTALTATVFRARYELLVPGDMQYFAGQTFMLTVAENVHRAMSIASPPQDTKILTSFQDVAPGGPGSKWMLNLKVGDEIQLMGPLGRFTIDHTSPRKKVLVATGTGIAPFHAMLLDTSDNRIPNEDISLYWGLRHEEDMYIYDELMKIDTDRDHLRFFFTLSQPNETWTGLKGHVTEHVLSQEKDPVHCDFYLCGNKKMINDLTEKLMLRGVPRTQFKFDPYF